MNYHCWALRQAVAILEGAFPRHLYQAVAFEPSRNNHGAREAQANPRSEILLFEVLMMTLHSSEIHGRGTLARLEDVIDMIGPPTDWPPRSRDAEYKMPVMT